MAKQDISVANQNLWINTEEVYDSRVNKRNFGRIHSDALELAIKKLDNQTFKLWVWFRISVVPNTKYAMGPSKFAEITGGGRSTFYRSVEALREAGYLIPVREDSNHFYLLEMPQEPGQEEADLEEEPQLIISNNQFTF